MDTLHSRVAMAVVADPAVPDLHTPSPRLLRRPSPSPFEGAPPPEAEDGAALNQTGMLFVPHSESFLLREHLVLDQIRALDEKM